jgi:hypothetical protein
MVVERAARVDEAEAEALGHRFDLAVELPGSLTQVRARPRVSNPTLVQPYDCRSPRRLPTGFAVQP